MPIFIVFQSGFQSNLLWMCFIHSSIHTYGNPHCPETTVFPNSTQDSGQTGSHQIGGPEGHYSADMLNSNTVFWRRHQIEPCEDLLGVLQSVFVSEIGIKHQLHGDGDPHTHTERQTDLLFHGCYVRSGYCAFSPQDI